MSEITAWTGAEGAPTESSRENALKCDSECDWAAAREVCSKLRGGIACKLEGDYSLGTRKLARKIRFDDNVCWVMCVWMNKRTNCELGFKSEAATCRFLSERTNLPTPKCHAWTPSSSNPVGRAYIILDFVEGRRANTLPWGPYMHPGEPAQWKYLLSQMAEYQVELASLKLPFIGSIFEADNGSFMVGRDIWSEKGPFYTAQAYYEMLSTSIQTHAMQQVKNTAELLIKNQSPGFLLPAYFSLFMPTLSNSHNDRGPFGLANQDFGLHNILIDDDFKITGIIDIDGIIAAPLPVCAQYPIHSPLDHVPAPGCRPNPDDRRISHYRNQAVAYVDAIRDAERRRSSEYAPTPIADAFEGTPARFVRALHRYGNSGDAENEEWMASMLYLTITAMKDRFPNVEPTNFAKDNLQDPMRDLPSSVGSWGINNALPSLDEALSKCMITDANGMGGVEDKENQPLLASTSSPVASEREWTSMFEGGEELDVEDLWVQDPGLPAIIGNWAGGAGDEWHQPVHDQDWEW